MAGIEDFVVQQIVNDFQNSAAAPQLAAQPQAPQSSFLEDAKYNYLANRGMAPGMQTDAKAPQGFTIADPAQRERYAQAAGQQAAAAATGAGLDRAMRERDAQRFKIMEGLRGLDPQIQSTILQRLGINAPALKSQIDQQKEILRYKQQLEAPQQETANAIKMLLATQGGQQNAAELALKQRSLEQEQASRGQTQNIQLMRVLAALMQSDASGKLQQTLSPILLQMLQGSGINLAPPAAGATGKSGIKITRE